jgi:hypothetical protein
VASPIEAQVILCDAAQSDPAGKLHMLGAGWSVTGSPTAPQAVAVLIKIPWDRTNQPLPLRLQLFDADGQPVLLPSPEGEAPLVVTTALEVGRPPRLPPGSPISASFALNIGSLPLAPGRYEWRLDIAGESSAASFLVQATPPVQWG